MVNETGKKNTMRVNKQGCMKEGYKGEKYKMILIY
jgi:hypothetical protein